MGTTRTRTIAIAVVGGLLFGLGACASPRTPQDRAVGIVELWLAALDAGDEDQAQMYACEGVQLGGVNSDGAASVGHEIDAITPLDDGRYGIDVTMHYPEEADLHFSFGVDTEDDLCIAWIR
jgi:hypothetical protein